jgi:hypothetical protein
VAVAGTGVSVGAGVGVGALVAVGEGGGALWAGGAAQPATSTISPPNPIS